MLIARSRFNLVRQGLIRGAEKVIFLVRYGVAAFSATTVFLSNSDYVHDSKLDPSNALTDNAGIFHGRKTPHECHVTFVRSRMRIKQ
jgi:hypothetical protein